MLDGDRERQEENRGRQREEWRVERGDIRGALRRKTLAESVERISEEAAKTKDCVEDVVYKRW
jgi:hypothetical protein